MDELTRMYALQTQQEKFAALVSARVNQIFSGTAQPIDMQKIGSIATTPQQDALYFADLIARNVCHNIDKIESTTNE
jgi:hypothetical protein